MGLFGKKQSKDLMQKAAERDAKKIYSARKMEIAMFLKGCADDDRDFFYKSIVELEELTEPYAGAISYPLSLEDDIKRIGDELVARLGQKGQRYAGIVYGVKVPVFVGYVRSIWSGDPAASLF